MTDNPLKSLASYSRFVGELLHRPTVKRSTPAIWSDSRYTGIAEGEVFFSNGIRLRVREELDFDACLITSYGYEVYRGRSDCIGMMTFRIRTTRIWPQRTLITSMCLPISNTTAFQRRR